MLLVIFGRSFKKYCKSSPQLAEDSLFLFMAGGRRRRRGRRPGGNEEEESGVPVPSRPAALGTRRNCQFYLHSSWLRAASHPVAGQPVDWPRSAAKCAAQGFPPPPWAIWRKFGFFEFFQNYIPPLGGGQHKKRILRLPTGSRGRPMPNLAEIHPVVWAPNPNKQTDRQASFI